MIPYPTDEEAKALIIAVGKRMYEKNYVVSNDGNISCKVNDDTLWTTPTGVCKGDLQQDMLVKVNLQGEILAGEYKPSSELKMHLRAYKENTAIKAITHAHPPMATSFAIAGKPLDQPILPEAIVQLGVVPLAPYATPGTEEVPDSIAPFCQDYQGVLLANHGVLTWGSDLWQAYFRLESLEYYATVSLYTGYILKAQQQLDEKQIARMIDTRIALGLGQGIAPTPQAIPTEASKLEPLIETIVQAVKKQMVETGTNQI